jgi:hypothetical protein
VGYIEANDWLGYRVNIPSAGTYRIQYRVASQSGGGNIRFERLGGANVYGSIAVSATGGWQTWTTISHNVQLSAGQQEVAIVAVAGGFNINWINISAVGGPVVPIGQTIWLRGNNNLYACSENGTVPMRCNRTTVAGWEQFTVVDAGAGKIALRSQNKYVSSENGAAAITCSRTAIGDWEKFDWVVNADGKISLRGNNGRYISSENGVGNMTCNKTAISGWEAFTWGTGTGARSIAHDENQMSESSSDDLSVFPNPSTGSVTIRVAKPSRISIVDVAGKSVMISDVKESITINHINSGIYIVNMSNHEKRIVRKLVVR